MLGLIFPRALSAHLKSSFGINKDKEDKKKQRENILKASESSLVPTFEYNTASSQFSSLASAEAVQWSQSLEQLLVSSCGLSVFKSFLQCEYSEENLEFWIACEDFKKTESSAALLSKAETIYNEFIQEESAKEINIDFQTRNDIKMAIQNPHPFCFDGAQKIVFRLMDRGPYLRFLKSDVYLNIINMPESRSHKS